MNKRWIRSLVVIIFLLVIFQVAESNEKHAVLDENDLSPFAGVMKTGLVLDDLPVVEESEVDVVAIDEQEVPLAEQTELYSLYTKMGLTAEQFYADLRLLNNITEAEAGNQSELGKRLVIDTVLNRIDSDRWRDDYTIWEVVAHPGQFETYSNGAYLKVCLDERISELIVEELLNRTNTEVMYFKTGGYFSGLPELFVEGDHWFSGEE